MPAYVVTWIHVVAVVTFIGGWMFVQFVIRPSMAEGKGNVPPMEVVEIVKKFGQRFKTVGWVSLIALIFTGASQLLDESGSARIETSWGLTMMLKLFVFAIVGGLIFVHDLILDPYGAPEKRQQGSGAAPDVFRKSDVGATKYPRFESGRPVYCRVSDVPLTMAQSKSGQWQ